MAFGSLLLRATVGGLLMGHGLQKLTGAFEGPGLEGTTGMMTALGIHPPRQNAVAVAAAETFGGAGIVLGAGTPAAAAAVIGAMVTAVRKVHWSNGPWNSKGGWEFNAALIAAVAALASDGPGPISVDGLLGRPRWGAGGALFALAAGVAGSYAVTEYAKRAAPVEPVREEDGSPAA